MDLNVTYFSPISLSGPLSFGLSRLPEEVHASFRLLKSTLPRAGNEGNPTVISAELVFGDGRWTALNPSISFRIIFEGIGTSPSVFSLSYEFNPILTQTTLNPIQ